MKKFAILLLALVVLALLIYFTFIIAILEIAVGAIILLVAAGILWWLWGKIKDKLD